MLVGCGFFGFYSAALYNAEERSIRKLIAVLDFMSCELQYRLTPLPDLCRQAANEGSGPLKKLFMSFTEELESQIAPDVKSCMAAAVSRCANLPLKHHGPERHGDLPGFRHGPLCSLHNEREAGA